MPSAGPPGGWLLAALLAAALTALGCLRPIPLRQDPLFAQPREQAGEVYEVDWWTPPLAPAGLLEFTPREYARPAVDVDSETLLVGLRDGSLRALSGAQGAPLWEKRAGTRFFAGAQVEGGVAYVPGSDGILYALDVATGEERWRYKAGEELVTVPVLSQGKVLVSAQNETLFAVDAASGAWAWQYRREPPPGFTIRGTAAPLAAGGTVYMSHADGALVALELETGAVRWERQLTQGGGTQFLDADGSPLLDESGQLYALSYRSGLYAVDAATGEVRWNFPRAGAVHLTRLANLIFLTGDGSVTAVDAARGQQVWSVDLSDRPQGRPTRNSGRAPVVIRGYLVVPTSSALVFVDPLTGRTAAAWNPGPGVTATPAAVSSARTGSRLYVLSNSSSVYALQVLGRGR